MISLKTLQDSINGRVEPIEITIWYKLALSIVAFAMAILPVIYLSIVAVSGWMVYYFVQDPWSVWQSDQRLVFMIFQYFAPVVFGLVLFFFMVKPLFTRIEKKPAGIPVSREDQPVLFGFIDMICSATEAPVPKSVIINCEVNAAASFENGMKGFFSNNLQLIIGLPLVSTMSASQFGGVLAHEFGHFSQGAGMRLTYIIRSINMWFYRLVFERDHWDERIVRWGENNHLAITIMLLLARLGVWISRKVLHGLLILGNLISGVMLRQMEFDADKYEVAFSGSDEFESSTKKIQLVTANWIALYNDIFESWSKKKMNNNIPEYLSVKVGRKDTLLSREVDKSIEEGKTGLFDTHPSDKQRIENAKKANKEGVFKLKEPAKGLFTNIEELSRRVTTKFYEETMGADFKEDYLVELEDYLKQDEAVIANNEALYEFFAQSISPLFPINFDEDENVYKYHDPTLRLREVSDFLQKQKEETAKLFIEKAQLIDQRSMTICAQELLLAGFKINPKEMGLKKAKLSEARLKLEKLKEEEAAINLRYNSIRDVIRKIPGLLRSKELLDSEERERLEKLVSLEILLSNNESLYAKINESYDRFFILGINQEAFGGNKKALSTFSANTGTLKDKIREYYSVFEDVNYPFESSGSVRVADYLFPDGVDKLLQEKIVNTVQTLNNLYSLLYQRVVGELGAMSVKAIAEEKGGPISEPTQSL